MEEADEKTFRDMVDAYRTIAGVAPEQTRQEWSSMAGVLEATLDRNVERVCGGDPDEGKKRRNS